MELGRQLLEGKPLDNLSSYYVKFEDLHVYKETTV
ncbi:hypothetical protein THOM_1729 [Trachipleistophora hominis]|uniref:Uncharacterized protein n=1 Tax=Trachipleistophora hominis TaxID=72359 RepID=L7JV36_TRAHO|nr:hypothetical protein THOM_1729 [Trachipleistophora hominis]